MMSTGQNDYMDATTPPAVPGDTSLPLEEPQGFLAQDRYGLTLGSLAALLLTLWISQTLNIPAVPERAGTILQQPNPLAAMATIWFAIALSAAVATVFASRNHYDGGLFCACISLAGLSSKFGPIRFALFAGNGAGVYLCFALELLLLTIPLAATWIVLHRLSSTGLLPRERLVDEAEVEESTDQKLVVTVAQALATILLMLLMCQSDTKKQTLASVAVASYLGALATYHFIATRPSPWYFAGPLIAGFVGYIGQNFNPADWMIGDARGFFAPLARPMPLDYASLGVAGAMLGYWTARTWHQTRLELEAEAVA